MTAAPKPSRRLALSLSQDHSAGPLSYLEMGKSDGPCVVFVHGLGANLLTWQLCMVPLASQYRVVAIDLPGHGRSTANVGEGTMKFMTDWLSETFDLLDISNPHIVGHSMGAKITLGYSMAHEARVSSVALISPAGLGGEFHHEALDRFLSEPTPANAEVVANLLLGPKGESLIPALTLSLCEAVSDKHRNVALRKLLEQAKTFGLALAPEGLNWDRLRCPVKILWGDHDRVIPLPDQRRLPPNSPVHLIEGAGHLPHLEASQTVVGVLREFLP